MERGTQSLDKISEPIHTVWLAVHRVDEILTADNERSDWDGLPQVERDRIERFRQPKDRRQRLAATLLARRALAQATGRPESDLRWQRTALGRPYLIHPEYPGDFNLSHHDEWVAVAWTNEGLVGVDLATIGEVREAVAKYAFSASEWEYLQTLNSGPKKARASTILWALKEAYGKALGFGMDRRRSRVSFVPATLAGERLVLAAPEAGWEFSVVQHDARTVLAVAHDRKYTLQRVHLGTGQRDIHGGQPNDRGCSQKFPLIGHGPSEEPL